MFSNIELNCNCVEKIRLSHGQWSTFLCQHVGKTNDLI